MVTSFVSRLSRQKSRYDPFDVNACSIKERNAFDLDVTQDQRKFGAAENQSINAVTLLHLSDDRRQALACFRQEEIVEQLSHVFLVDECAFCFVGDDDLDSGFSKDFPVELSLHRKARTEQGRPLQFQIARSISCGLNDTDHWHRYASSNLIENNMRGVGSKHREIHARTKAEVKALETKEESEIRALLTDDQKKELRDIEDKTTADRKARSGRGSSKNDESDKDESDSKKD